MTDNWPLEYADQLILGNPESNVAICCLWSLRERLKSSLQVDEYSVIGNLYSRAGISPMLRNLLANPRIRYLILTGKSLTDSDDALIKFFNHGVDADSRIIGNGGQIDEALPISVLQDVRDFVQLIDMRGTRHFAEAFGNVSLGLKQQPPYAEARTFRRTVTAVPEMPGERSGFLIRGRTIIDTWSNLLRVVMDYGRITPTDYGLPQKEIVALLSVVEQPSPILGIIPDWAPFAQPDVENYLVQFFAQEKSDEIAYNYGYRLQARWGDDQIALIAQELRKAEYSRRALASLWEPVRDNSSSDPPCITSVQAVVREKCLHLTAYIRSNDMFRAYPLNAAALAELQSRIAHQLNDLEIGPLSIYSYSAHIYSDCWDVCQNIVSEAALHQKRFEQDPRGSFVFRIEDGKLVADHFSPEGDLLQSITADSSAELVMRIAPFISRIDHAIYLGREIDRLSAALHGKAKYVQDKV